MSMSSVSSKSVGYERTCNDDLFDVWFSSSYSPRHLRKVRAGYLSSVAQQQKYAEKKLQQVERELQVVRMQSDTFNKAKKEQLEEDVWAWSIFSQTILPMLSFLDE